MNKTGGISQEDFVKLWFASNPDRDISHLESKPAIENAWLTENGSRIEDADRAIRKLAEQGILRKVKNGVYRYESNQTSSQDSEMFSEFTKTAIFERDGFQCKVCGATPNQRVDLHVVPILRFELGGNSSVSNGQTVCSVHKIIDNLINNSKNISRSELRKLLDKLSPRGKFDMIDNRRFLSDLLEIVEKNSRDQHIIWKNFI